MIEVLVPLVSLGALDALNPATILTMLMLIPLARKTWHPLIFVLGTLVTYFTLGILWFYGLDAFVNGPLADLVSKSAGTFRALSAMLGAALVGIGAYLVWRFMIRGRVHATKVTKGGTVLSVAPLFLAFLSVTSTVSDFPTAVPYFGFLAILLGLSLGIAEVALALLMYGLIYISPLVLIYIGYGRLKDRVPSLLERSRSLMGKLVAYVLPVVLLGAGAWLLAMGLSIV